MVKRPFPKCGFDLKSFSELVQCSILFHFKLKIHVVLNWILIAIGQKTATKLPVMIGIWMAEQ